MKRFLYLSICILVSALWGCAVNITLAPMPEPLKEKVIEGQGRPKLLLLEVSGFISDREESTGMGFKAPSMVARIKESLVKAAGDRDVSGVIIKINSPGGTVTASDIIYHEIQQFKKQRQIPVYANIIDLGTSGGYYIAAAADEISAHPTAITGSIGVIALKFNVAGLLDKVGVEADAVKSGDKKDLWSPFRPSTPEEKEIIQAIIGRLYSRFLDVVFESRSKALTRKEVEALSDGRIYTAGQALEARLVDRIAYMDETVEAMKKALKLSEARVVTYYRAGEYKSTVYSLSPSDRPQAISLININADGLTGLSSPSGAQFLYLWRP